MKLPQTSPTVDESKSVKIKKKKTLDSNKEAKVKAAVAEALKKPRTRSVSLTLSENGINVDDPAVEAESKKDRSKAKKEKSKSTAELLEDTSKPKKVKKSVLSGAENLPKKVKKEPKKKNEEADQPDTTADTDDGVPAEHADGRFSNFPLREKTIVKLKAKGINYLFPIQVQTYRKVLEGKDVIAKARTGTGKTLAFALPLIEKLETEKPKAVKAGRPPRVIVMAPTRELVNQVAKDFQALSGALSIHCFYGGVSMHEQGRALRSGIDILVGTPGRLRDWISRGALDTSKLEHVVLDEVDQMLDMGFADDVESIISHSYNRGEGMANPQTLLFSATLPSWVTKTAKKYMETMPPVIDLVGNSVNQTATLVTHLAIKSHWKDMASNISKMIQYYSGDNGRSIIFCDTKRDVDELAMCADIKQNKEKLHGDVAQSTRESVLQQFRQGKLKVLVATNVAARGLDIPEVDLVVQTHPPTSDIDQYIHRAGRTGRAGKSGVCICLYSNKNEHDLNRVERFAKIVFKRVNVPTSDDLVKTGMKELTSSIEGIGEDVLARFKDVAEDLISERGAVNTVAALIALATNQTKLASLINGREGFITLLYKTNATIQFKGYVFNVIKKCCPDLNVVTGNAIMNMNLLKNGKGAVFDVSDDVFKKYEETLVFESFNDSITKATELPELKPNPTASGDVTNSWKSGGNNGGRNSFGGNSGGRNSFGGNRGGQNSFRGNSRNNSFGGSNSNTGFKRPSSGNSIGSGQQAKRIKFDD